jgi:energy-coupling factor transport system ATP-binding protein
MIEVNNLSFSYIENKPVISNISLKINKGEWVSILGHNGSGKSTFAKLLIGLYEPEAGEIYYGEGDDKVLLSAKTVNDIRKKVGIVFQNPDNQFVGATVRHDIAFGMENQQIPREEMEVKILQVAEFVGMTDFLNKEPQQLSGGQKQKVAISGAVAMYLDIIIFDEATSMLDPKGTKDIIDLIKVLNQEYNKIIITITHDLEFANLSNRAIVFKEGEKILEGTPEEIFKHEKLLISSNLELPFSIKLENELRSSNFSNQEKVVKSLCKYNSIK